MKQENPDILFGSIIKRLDVYEYVLKVSLSTNVEIGIPQTEVVIEPLEITVNNVKYEAINLETSFVESSLIGKKAMFVVRQIEGNNLIGELYKLPFGSGNSIIIPNGASEMFNTFNTLDYKEVV